MPMDVALAPPSSSSIPLALYPMRDLAIKNGAHEYLVKSHVSGDNLAWAIQTAILSVAFQNAHHS